MVRTHQHQGTHDRTNSANSAGTRRRRCLSRLNLSSLLMLGLVTLACSSNESSGGTGPGGIGGGTGTNTGGNGTGTGGASGATGGASNSTVGGNSAATGGSPSTGGNSSTGSAAGGAATGGTSAAPGSTGGAGTGGKSSSSVGGATGGKSSTNATGGAATGGKSSTATTGGAATGGQSSTAETGGTTGAGGTATGGTSAGGSSACSAATITKVSDSDYQLTICDVTMHVNPKIGARVTSLTLGSANIIQQHTATSYDGNATSNNAGITFWTSPQSSWTPTWPPVAAIDGNSYTVTDAGTTSGHLVLTGAADSNLGASVVKDFSADPATGWITIKYTIKATKAIQVAPWQIARVPRAGIVFFPCATAAIKSPSVTWTLSQASGYDWIDDKNQTSVTAQSDGSKYVANGAAVSGESYTLLGYALGGKLLLFKYPDASTFATGEGDTEVYPGTGYIELESQGDYGQLAANGTLSWSIQMRVDPIDTSSVTVASGSATLISFAEKQAAL